MLFQRHWYMVSKSDYKSENVEECMKKKPFSDKKYQICDCSRFNQITLIDQIPGIASYVLTYFQSTV